MDILGFLRPKARTLAVGVDQAESYPGVEDNSPQWREPAINPWFMAATDQDTLNSVEFPGMPPFPGQDLGGYSWEREEARDHNLPDYTCLGEYFPTLPNYRRTGPYIPVLVEGMQVRSAAGLNGYPSQGRGSNDHAHLPPIGFTDPDGTFGVAMNAYTTSADPVEVPAVLSPPWNG